MTAPWDYCGTTSYICIASGLMDSGLCRESPDVSYRYCKFKINKVQWKSYKFVFSRYTYLEIRITWNCFVDKQEDINKCEYKSRDLILGLNFVKN